MKPVLHIIAFLTLVSCTADKGDKASSFQTLVDTSANQRTIRNINFLREQTELLNLSSIFQGVDSFELRIWSFGFWTRTDLLTMRYSRNQWLVSNHIYYDNNGIVDSLHMISRKVSNDTAARIQNYLVQDSILKFPTQDDIPNFVDNSTDGETYYIEISTKGFYKFLSYHNPDLFKDPYNTQFLRILKFISNHYQIHYPF